MPVGRHRVGMTINEGVDLIDATETLMVDITPSVHEVIPKTGSTRGNTAVRFYGKNFSPSTFCRFGTSLVEATLLSSSELLCITPAAPRGIVQVSVTTSDVATFVPQNQVFFQFVPTPTLLSIVPAAGPSAGNLVIQVIGKGFFYSEEIGCAFGESVTKATYLSSSRLKCVAPAHAPGNVTLGIRQLQAESVEEVSSNTVLFEYLPSHNITSISPSYAPDVGGALVTVIGQGFDMPEWWCTFGCNRAQDTSCAIVKGDVKSSSHIECITPALPVSFTTIGVVSSPEVSRVTGARVSSTELKYTIQWYHSNLLK